MLAVVKEAAEEGAIAVREIEPPCPGPGQVVIAVKAASICGSDLHIYHWAPAFHGVLHPPTILGHELSGTIAELGPGVAGWQVGDRVVPESLLACRDCPRCRRGRFNICDGFRCLGVHRDGGMSQRALVEASLLHRVPDALSFELAAVVEPLAVATHAVLARSGVRAGDQALVLGPGPIGLFVAQVARAAGARVVVAGIEADQEVRLATASRLGFGTINVEREALSAGLERLTGEPKVDLIYECAGSGAAVASALEATHKGGTIVLVALYSGPIQAELAWTVRRELSILASYGATWDDFERSIAFLDRGVVDARSIISTYPLCDGARAFDDALAQRVLKPVLLP